MANRARKPISTRPTPRGRQDVPSGATTALFCLFMFALLALSLWWGITHLMPAESDKPKEAIVKHDSLAPTYTHDGEIIRWYVFTDPDSSVQYLVNDRGGCTPRLNQYGNVVGVQTSNDYD